MSIERIERRGGEVVWRVRWRDGASHNRSRVLGRKRDAEAFDAVERIRHQKATTQAAVTSALIVATGSSTFQPKRMSWS